MKVLIYIGYQAKQLDYNDFIQGNHIGGTEIVSLKLAETLVKYGIEAYFGGQINNGFHNGVEWIDISQCGSKHFDMVISSSYLHFIDTIDSKYKFLWLHNTDWYPWRDGEDIYNIDYINRWDMTGLITLTQWHKDFMLNNFSIKKEVHVIGNSIDRKTFNKKDKIRGSFIYSSAAERGLYRLLHMWPKVLAVMPHATLNVFCPGYSKPNVEIWPEGVTYHGTVSQDVLHDWQMKSEYWLYPTSYEETYCVTALEMQYAGVIPITTPVAALGEVVGDRGVLLNPNETDDAFVDIIKELERSPERKQRLREKGHEWAKQQSWNIRILEWLQLIRKNAN